MRYVIAGMLSGLLLTIGAFWAGNAWAGNPLANKRLISGSGWSRDVPSANVYRVVDNEAFVVCYVAGESGDRPAISCLKY